VRRGELRQFRNDVWVGVWVEVDSALSSSGSYKFKKGDIVLVTDAKYVHPRYPWDPHCCVLFDCKQINGVLQGYILAHTEVI
jgi:hypothetical protein